MCKEATRLMSLKHERSLTFQEKMSLRLHLSMCGACRQCDRQFALLREACRQYVPDHEADHEDDGR
ncbi:MAG TPA: zf-HC2 domain-containing protein [Halomonas sp.]|nr:zf-HC2 domain-containing protein [Halomonas sp.]